jgi:hypothetical protein
MSRGGQREISQRTQQKSSEEPFGRAEYWKKIARKEN